MDYKSTLNLPQTGFAMKADLVQREPQRLEKWRATGLYERIQQARAGRPTFVLHDGPPFANGDVHVGTALNKILKDLIIRHRTLRGFNAPYVPGWDCHGLPIEFKVSQEMRKAGDTSADPVTIRRACDAYARKYIDLQRAQFKRLGVLGDWEQPYLTLDQAYEADELRLFADIVDKGFVYRGKKPVYWSIPARTALAEAEVEYHDHISPSVYVKFPVVGQPRLNLVIWTTTPWTLPANLAVAYNQGFSYSLVRAGEDSYIVSTMLLPTVAATCGWDGYEIIRSLHGEDLAELEYQHPFCARTGRLHPAPFVENSTGTGFVHIAPGHGLEDYGLGSQLGLPIYSPVDDDGRLALTNDLPRAQQMPDVLVGTAILEKNGRSDANEAVLTLLREGGNLLKHEPYSHSYPHCWRSKTPVIFRAMDQWFIRIDHAVPAGSSPGPATFREQAVAEIDRVKWVPDWGVNRIKSAVQSRPDWCISRQRTWGVPIPAFYDRDGRALLDARIVRQAADLIEQHGSNVWFEKTAAELWALCKPADWSGAEAVTKSNDTLDVWIDSGSSSRAVLMRRRELRRSAGVSPASPSPETPALRRPDDLTAGVGCLHDRLTGWPTTVAGQADLGSDEPRDGQAARLFLSRLEALRARRLEALRVAAAEAGATPESLGLPLIRLDDLGWKQSRAERARFSRPDEAFTEDASSRLAYVGEGQEAFVYRDPVNLGVVYKFFPRNGQASGYGLVERLFVEDGLVQAIPEFSGRLTDLLDKLVLLNAMGLPSEVLGITEEGTVVVKQAEVRTPSRTEDSPPAEAETNGLPWIWPPREVFAFSRVRALEAKIVLYRGRFWLLSDLWEANRMEDADGKVRVIDALVSEVPWVCQAASAASVNFFSAARDWVSSRSPRDVTGQSDWQADLYLEGSDQHRGWFQSSLLLSLAGNGVAPYKTVLTHGFMVDEDREKISKSKQGQRADLKPQTADRFVNDFGADVLRLWVASQDFRNDIVVSEERLKKVAETYRLLRNTLRYQLSNLYDFHPAHDALADADLTGLDRWILGEFSALERAVDEAYQRYEFHVVYQRVSQFVAVELSSIYHDVVKDRLYTDPANSRRRRSTQTALHRMVTGLSQMLSPLLVFTADEAWDAVPAAGADSVHQSEWTPSNFPVLEAERALWRELFALREQVLPELEKARQAKLIGKALEAKVSIRGLAPHVKAAGEREGLLAELLNVSALELTAGDGTNLAINVAHADGKKCERCWHWETTVGAHPEYPTLCPRCIEAVQVWLAKASIL